MVKVDKESELFNDQMNIKHRLEYINSKEF